jgi:hypothetical protein
MDEGKKKGSSYSRRDKDYIHKLLLVFSEPAARPKAEIEDVRAT